MRLSSAWIGGLLACLLSAEFASTSDRVILDRTVCSVEVVRQPPDEQSKQSLFRPDFDDRQVAWFREHELEQVRTAADDDKLVLEHLPDDFELFPQDVIITRALSAAVIDLFEEATLKLRDKTRIRLEWDANQVVVELEDGQIWLDIGPELPLVIKQGTTSIELSDATIQIAYSPDDFELIVGMVRGSAQVSTRVEDEPATQTLKAGSKLIIGEDETSTLPSFAPGEVIRLTQAEQASLLMSGLGLESELPTNATDTDTLTFLSRLGLAPCGCKAGLSLLNGLARYNNLPPGVEYRADMQEEEARELLCDNACISGFGQWDPEKPINFADLACILGLSPDVEIGVLSEMLDPSAQIREILKNHPEIFWLQTRRRIPVSPFAP